MLPRAGMGAAPEGEFKVAVGKAPRDSLRRGVLPRCWLAGWLAGVRIKCSLRSDSHLIVNLLFLRLLARHP